MSNPVSSHSQNLYLGQIPFGSFDWERDYNHNFKIIDFITQNKNNNVISGLAVTAGAGLTVNWAAGSAIVNGTTYAVGSSSGSATDNTADTNIHLPNYIFVNNSGAVTISTSLPTTEYTPLAIVFTNAGAISKVVDGRKITSSSDTITNKTSNYSLVAADLTGRIVLTNYNAGATQVNFTLLSATAGLVTHFLVSAESGDTGGIKITAGASDVINESGITTATGGNVQYNAGGLMVTAICYVNNKWTISKKGAEEIAIFKDEKVSGTDGGTSSTGDNIRVLNTTTISKIKNAALASNRISLPAGTYEFEAEAVCENGNQHSVFIRNYTDSTTPSGTLGIASRANGSGVETTALLKGTVSITATKEFELYHYIASGFATNGLGRPVGSGNNEVYATVKVKRL